MKPKTFWLEAWKHMMERCPDSCMGCPYNFDSLIFGYEEEEKTHLNLRILMRYRFTP